MANGRPIPGPQRQGNGRFLTSISIVNQRPLAAFRERQPIREKGMPTIKSGGSKRGFAAMDPAKQREIASKGGKASHGGGRRPSTSR
jgi:hypothetical protein